MVAVQESAVGIDKVNLPVTIPFPEPMLPAAPERHSWPPSARVEPSVTLSERKQGAEVLGHLFQPNVKSPVSPLLARRYDPLMQEENPEIVKSFRFCQRSNRANRRTSIDPAIARKTIGEHTKIPASHCRGHEPLQLGNECAFRGDLSSGRCR